MKAGSGEATAMQQVMLRPNGKLNVFSYTNYRKYLRDYFELEKRRLPQKFSHRYFARKAGLATSNFLYLVIEGKRNLSPESIQSFSRAIGLDRRETLFFEAATQFDQAKGPHEKDSAFEKMISFREYRQARIHTARQYDYFAKWHHPVIRELVHLNDFQEDPAWIVGKLNYKVSREEARESLELLQELDYLVRDENGRLTLNDPTLMDDSDVSAAARLMFQDQMMELGRMSLTRPSKERDVSAITMTVNGKILKTIKEKMQLLKDEIHQMMTSGGEDRADSVYQLNFQLFSLTGKEAGVA